MVLQTRLLINVHKTTKERSFVDDCNDGIVQNALGKLNSYNADNGGLF